MPLEGPGGCLGRVLGAMLDDAGCKMVVFRLSWAMLWHLGAKMSQQEPRRANAQGFGGGRLEPRTGGTTQKSTVATLLA